MEGNPGFGAANNAALALVTEPVTILLNPDCRLIDSGLERLAAAAAGRTRETAPPALTPCTAACAAVNKGVSSRRSPATSKPPDPTASRREDALNSTRD